MRIGAIGELNYLRSPHTGRYLHSQVKGRFGTTIGNISHSRSNGWLITRCFNWNRQARLARNELVQAVGGYTWENRFRITDAVRVLMKETKDD